MVINPQYIKLFLRTKNAYDCHVKSSYHKQFLGRKTIGEVMVAEDFKSSSDVNNLLLNK